MQAVFEFYIPVLRWFLSALYVFADFLYTVFPLTIEVTEIFYKWNLFLLVSLLGFFFLDYRLHNYLGLLCLLHKLTTLPLGNGSLYVYEY